LVKIVVIAEDLGSALKLVCDKLSRELNIDELINTTLPTLIRHFRAVPFEDGVVFYGAEILDFDEEEGD
jgi:hypothetical protein